MINSKNVMVFVIALIVVIGGGYLISSSGFDKLNNIDDQMPMACTMDAKVCPDGSAVGRTGPKCEFAACPGTTPTTTVTSGIKGLVLAGPACPGPRKIGDECDDKPLESTFVVTHTNSINANPSTKTVGNFKSGKDGRFSVNLPPGEYYVNQTSPDSFPRCESDKLVRVSKDRYTEINISCDTGIR